MDIKLQIFLISIGLIVTIWQATRNRDKWGISLSSTPCPHCNAPLPRVRRPKNWQQIMWGGSTCPSCGAKVDKWGRLLQPPEKD